MPPFEEVQISVGLLAVVDDVLTAAPTASAKTAGIVIDDAAVTPQYVRVFTPARELHVVRQIALGSLFNNFIIIPLALLLSAFAPWVLPWLLIIGGTYLCFEGAEKVTEWFGAHHETDETEPRDERKLVFGPTRTDLILSTEIMLIALAGLDPDFGTGLTLGALAVIGLGARIVRSMPAVFRVIGVIGTVAMLWVSGLLVIAKLADTFWHGAYDVVHAVTRSIESAGPVVVWVADTAMSAVFGLILGLIIVAIFSGVSHFLERNRTDRVAA